jgi:predicted PurR-regulated permease PerM
VIHADSVQPPIHVAAGTSPSDLLTTTQSPALTFIALLLAVAAIWSAQLILIPLVLGVLGSYALEPFQRRLVSWRLPAPLASALILITLLSGLIATGFAMRTQTAAFVSRLPAAAQRMRELLRDPDGSPGAMVHVQQAAQELTKAADEPAPAAAQGVPVVRLAQPEFRMGEFLWRGSLGAAGAIGQATIVLFMLFYFLSGGDIYKRKIVKIAGPSLTEKRITLEILNQISDQVSRFLLARVIISLIVGVATGAAFWAMGVAQPAMWGIGAGILNTIPYVGPCAVSAAAGIAGLMQFGTGSMAAVLALTSLGIAALEGSLVTPWLMGRASRMNPGAVFVALSFWGWIWGIWGLLLAVPIMMAIKAVCDHVDGWSGVSELLND